MLLTYVVFHFEILFDVMGHSNSLVYDNLVRWSAILGSLSEEAVVIYATKLSVLKFHLHLRYAFEKGHWDSYCELNGFCYSMHFQDIWS